MSIINRIKQFIEYLDIPDSTFVKEVGISNGYLNKVKTIGSDKILSIFKKYPDLSLEWLITGEGEMLKKEKDCSESVNPEETSPLWLLEEYKKIAVELGEKNKVIEELTKQVKLLEEEKNKPLGYSIAAEPKSELKRK